MILTIAGVHCDSFIFSLINIMPTFLKKRVFVYFMMLLYYFARLDVLLIPVFFFLILKDFSCLNKAFIYYY